MATPRSLILITVDCLRADHVGFLGYKRPTTPFLDSLAAESLVFRNAIVAGAPTYYSFPAIMASRYALALGRDVIGLAPNEATLATTLRESGYATAAFVAGNPYLSPRFGYNAGFETFRDFLDAKTESFAEDECTSDRNGWISNLNRSLAEFCHAAEPLGSIYDELYFQYCQRLATGPARSLDALRRFPAADLIVDQAAGWLATVAGRPFFLWLHLMDPHAPYYPPEKALELLGQPSPGAYRARYLNSYWNRGGLSANRFQSSRDEVVGLYDAGVRWADAQAERMANLLRQLNLWESCAVAVTADHGEEFLDHGGRYHAPPRVTEEMVHVPLLLHVPQMKKPEPVPTPFSLLDLAPTLLEVIDAQVPGSFRGRSRWAQLQSGRSWGDPAIVECIGQCTNPFRLDGRLGARVLAIRETRFKLVLDFSSSTEFLFDLETDPGELQPLSEDTEKPVRRRLLERVRRHLTESLQSRDPDSRLAARLRDFRLEWASSSATIST